MPGPRSAPHGRSPSLVATTTTTTTTTTLFVVTLVVALTALAPSPAAAQRDIECDASCISPKATCTLLADCKSALGRVDAALANGGTCNAACQVEAQPSSSSLLSLTGATTAAARAAYWSHNHCYFSCARPDQEGKDWLACPTRDCWRMKMVCEASSGCRQALDAVEAGLSSQSSTSPSLGGDTQQQGSPWAMLGNCDKACMDALVPTDLSDSDRALLDDRLLCVAPRVECGGNATIALEPGFIDHHFVRTHTMRSNSGFLRARITVTDDSTGETTVLSNLKSKSCDEVRRDITISKTLDLDTSYTFAVEAENVAGVASSCAYTVQVRPPPGKDDIIQLYKRMRSVRAAANTTASNSTVRRREVRDQMTSLKSLTAQQLSASDINMLSLSLLDGVALARQDNSTADLMPPKDVAAIFGNLMSAASAATMKQAKSTDRGPIYLHSSLRQWGEDIAESLQEDAEEEFQDTTGSFSMRIRTFSNANFNGAVLKASNSSNDTFYVPSDLRDRCSGKVSLLFVSYQDDRMFPAGKPSFGKVLTLDVPGCDVSNFSTPIAYTLNTPDGTTSRCVFYDLDTGGWSDEGMETGSRVGNSTLCYTYHLSNFAVMVSSDAATSGVHADALSVITIIGCSLSIIGLLLTFITHISYEILRKSMPSRLLLHLCGSLIVALSLFLAAGEHADANSRACQAIGVFMHFAWMVALWWMLVQGIHLYAITVQVLNINESKRLMVYTIVGYTVPLVLVGVNLAIVGTDDYGAEALCWINNDTTLWNSFILPLLIIMGINIVLFVRIFWAIHSHASKRLRRSSMSANSPSSMETRSREARAAVALFFLLGLSWVFGALIDTDDGDASLTLQYLFAITTTMQGVFIFFFYCLGNSQVMDEYRKTLGQDSSSSARRPTHSQGAPPKANVRRPNYSTSESAAGASPNFGVSRKAMAASRKVVAWAEPAPTGSTGFSTNENSSSLASVFEAGNDPEPMAINTYLSIEADDNDEREPEPDQLN